MLKEKTPPGGVAPPDAVREREGARLVLPAQDGDRLRWLAKDLGYRGEAGFEGYVGDAVRLFLQLAGYERAGRKLFFGANPFGATPFELPCLRETPYQSSGADAGGLSLTVTLSHGQMNLLEDVCALVSPEHFVWCALWGYYDLRTDYDAGKRVYVGTADEGPQEEVELLPEVTVELYPLPSPSLK
jgi:hypothetical protein